MRTRSLAFALVSALLSGTGSTGPGNEALAQSAETIALAAEADAAERDAAARAAEVGDPDDADHSQLPAGHSMHGEAFNDGPRQAAYLMGATGTIHFPVTTALPLVQQYIDQGVGQLHGFWWYEAERSFRQAAALDPDCAMAYWGMAMANAENGKRAKEFITEAVGRREGVTRREQMYIDALAAFFEAPASKDKTRRRDYVLALEEIVQTYPEDIEAKAFLALIVWQNRERGWPLPSYQVVEALIQQVLAVEPMHPVHHYRIHLWDDEKASMALTSAALCGQSAPSIAHMWHMSGHIFSKLRRYHDAIWQQEASARVDHAYMIHNHVIPDQIHNYAHNHEWMIRNLSNVGRARDAIRRAQDMIEWPRHPRYNTLTKGSARYGRMRLFEVLATYELWDELIALAGTPYLEPTDLPAEQVKRLRYLGSAHFQQGDLLAGQECLDQLNARLDELKAERRAAVDKAQTDARAEGLDTESIEEAASDARETFVGRIDAVAQAIAELEGHLSVAMADYESAFQQFEDAQGISNEVLSRVHLLAGNYETAIEFARDAVTAGKSQVAPLANYVSILEQTGDREGADQAFEELRLLASQAELDLPVLQRASATARRLGLPDDWRLPLSAAPDVGERPEIAQLGPIAWQPFVAPSWSLDGPDGLRVSLADYRGKPVVVVLYLGFGCVHCVEQLKALKPMTQQFTDAGIEVVAIGTDPVDAIEQSLGTVPEEERYPFKILSGADLAVFHDYRAYDDFEDQPLHATLLIDGDGMIRFRDVSYEPFTDIEFLLDESKRLLSLPTTNSRRAAGRAADAAVSGG